MDIDISDIDKVELLRHLWREQAPATFYTDNSLTPPFDENEARYAIRGYIDYFCGRCIKSNLTRDRVNPALYDQDAGEGKFAEIVTNLRHRCKNAVEIALRYRSRSLANI